MTANGLDCRFSHRLGWNLRVILVRKRGFQDRVIAHHCLRGKESVRIGQQSSTEKRLCYVQVQFWWNRWIKQRARLPVPYRSRTDFSNGMVDLQ